MKEELIYFLERVKQTTKYGTIENDADKSIAYLKSIDTSFPKDKTTKVVTNEDNGNNYFCDLGNVCQYSAIFPNCGDCIYLCKKK